MAAEDGPNTRWSKPDAHRGQLTVDPPISPSGVLTRQPEDDIDGAGGDARSPGAVGIGPSASDEVTVPTEQGLGLHEEPLSVPPIKESAQSGEQCSIAGSKGRAGHLAAKDRHLMAEHDDLDGQLPVFPPREPDQLKHSDEGQVKEGQRHGPASSLRTIYKRPAGIPG